MPIKLSIIIVNYYSEELVQNCVNSILKYNSLEKDAFEIIIVDNGSNTEIFNDLESNHIKILTKNKNLGFGTACNLAVKESNSSNILFLNPDTHVFENTISEALKYIEGNPQITVLGCQQIDENSYVLKTCTTFLSLYKYIVKSLYLDKIFPKLFKSYLMTYWDHKDSRYVDHVMGSFYIIRKKAFEILNGFDEDYFLYYEDADLSKRVIDSGGKIYYNTRIQIFHEGGGASKNFKAQRLFYGLDAVLTFSKKHFSKQKHFLMLLFVLFIEPFLRFFNALFRFDFIGIKQMFMGYRLLFKKRIFN